MPDTALLETFPTPADTPFLVEHHNEEFTSVCPVTGHPDFGTILIRFEPGATCVELKSLKLYFQSFRNEGIYYEAVTNRIRDDLVESTISPEETERDQTWRVLVFASDGTLEGEAAGRRVARCRLDRRCRTRRRSAGRMDKRSTPCRCATTRATRDTRPSERIRAASTGASTAGRALQSSALRG